MLRETPRNWLDFLNVKIIILQLPALVSCSLCFGLKTDIGQSNSEKPGEFKIIAAQVEIIKIIFQYMENNFHVILMNIS